MYTIRAIILILLYILDFCGLRYVYSAISNKGYFWGLLAAIVIVTILQWSKHSSSKNLTVSNQTEFILDNQTGKPTDTIFLAKDYPGFSVLYSEGNSTTYCDSTGSMISTVKASDAGAKVMPVLLRTGYLVFMLIITIIISIIYISTAKGLFSYSDTSQVTTIENDSYSIISNEGIEEEMSPTSVQTLANGDPDPEEFYLQLDSRRITEEELDGFSQVQLQYIINSLYAMHGRTYRTPEYNEYYCSKSWYSARDISDEEIISEMSDIMIDNLDTLVAYRKKKGWNN